MRNVIKGHTLALKLTLVLLAVLCGAETGRAAEKLRSHRLNLDSQGKIIPWFSPADRAFDNYLDKCWAWALAAPPDSQGLPISFLYCAWKPGTPPTASPTWENDVGEKLPNWVESARLYYQYCGDRAPLDYVRRFADYCLAHGLTPPEHVWPSFPVGTSNAGDTEFRGFTERWALWDCHVDLAADMGLALYRLYQIYGDKSYRDMALHVADLLAANIRPGTADQSPWPYVVNSKNGETHSRYAASWDGALSLFDLLIRDSQGRPADYERARGILKTWLLAYPMKNGNWVDGHSDTRIDGTGNLSTTCASDMCLYLLEHPGWDPDFRKDVTGLLRWTEMNFVETPTPDSLPGVFHGAWVPAEQTQYNYRMGYQAARLGAQYALWYRVSGDSLYRDRAFRCLSYNTYMMDENGQSSDGPTDEVGWWWSDCYGEAPRMYYYALAAVPEWSNPDESHLLYCSSAVTAITYTDSLIAWDTWDNSGQETLRLCAIPNEVLAGGVALPRRNSLDDQGWSFDSTSGVLRVRHDSSGSLRVRLVPQTRALRVDVSKEAQVIDGFGVNANHRSWVGDELKPVLNALIDSAGMTLFRVVFDNADWETVNDNDDPLVMNHAVYDSIYASSRFQPLWEMFAWLNARGLSRSVFFNFMGPGPQWMGGGHLTEGLESEWAETIASFLLYARNTKGLKFSLIAPNNEPDIQNEGIHVEAAQYVRCLHALTLALERCGLGDLRFVAPDRAGGGTDYLPEILADTLVMSHLSHFGMHSYSDNGGGSNGVEEFLQRSAYPDRTFWMTEFNVWLPNADNGQRGTYDWPYCRGTAKYLLEHLANGASGGIVWEGYDSYYFHPPATWSFWGLFSLDNELAQSKNYTARKNFYTMSQISRFVRPGAHRVEVVAEEGPLSPLLAFYRREQGYLSLVGLNSAAAPVTLSGRIDSAPGVTALELYYTSKTENMVRAGRVQVTAGAFTVTVPADCVFSLVSPVGDK